MKENQIKFVRKVSFTTFLAFFLISFIYLGTFALLGKKMGGGGTQTLFQFFSYVFGKLYVCVFPFSLCLGFLNRLVEGEKNRAVMRVIHFLLGFAAYFVFMDLVFNYLFLMEGETVATRQILLHTLPYFVFYPITLWLTSLGRALFLPKEKKEFKSILD